MKFYKKYFSLLLSLFLIACFFTSCKKEKKTDDSQTGATVTDIDGNTYHTVKIGTQIWMVENLKTTRYRNGDPIPHVAESIAWHDMTTPAYCSYNNDAAYAATYGYLYNWHAVNDSRNIAPEGWRVATREDWQTLYDFAGGLFGGGKLKTAGTTHWQSPNEGATNATGFSGLPGGERNLTMSSHGAFDELGIQGNWWTSTAWASTNRAIYAHLRNSNNKIIISGNDASSPTMGTGLSVRCIKN